MATQTVCDACGKTAVGNEDDSWSHVHVRWGLWGVERNVDLCLDCLPGRLGGLSVMGAYVAQALRKAQDRLGIKTRRNTPKE